MCFAFDARPPELPPGVRLPIAGGAAAERLELESADGTRFSAAFAETPESRGRAVVILPDVRGLYRFYVELAERFAAAGHHAIAIDYFGRTAGVAERDQDFEWGPHIAQTTPLQIQADIAAAAELLHERTGESSVVTVGFCFGGRQAYIAAAGEELDLAGSVAFYGGLAARMPGMPSPLEYVGRMRGPILGLFGGADQGIPPEQVAEFDQALTGARVEHEFVTYPGAPHSFFDRKFEEYAEACEDAWRRVLGFLET
jgi:carboxymethylenebutenolidase